MKKITVFLFALLSAALLAFPVSASEAEGGVSGEGIGVKILVSLLIGLAVALLIVFLMKRSMSTVRKQKNASEYVVKDSFRLTDSRDIYLYSTVTRVRINTDRKSR